MPFEDDEPHHLELGRRERRPLRTPPCAAPAAGRLLGRPRPAATLPCRAAGGQRRPVRRSLAAALVRGGSAARGGRTGTAASDRASPTAAAALALPPRPRRPASPGPRGSAREALPGDPLPRSPRSSRCNPSPRPAESGGGERQDHGFPLSFPGCPHRRGATDSSGGGEKTATRQPAALRLDAGLTRTRRRTLDVGSGAQPSRGSEISSGNS